MVHKTTLMTVFTLYTNQFRKSVFTSLNNSCKIIDIMEMLSELHFRGKPIDFSFLLYDIYGTMTNKTDKKNNTCEMDYAIHKLIVLT